MSHVNKMKLYTIRVVIKSDHPILYKACLYTARLVVDVFNYSVDSIRESLQHNASESFSNFDEIKFYKR